MKIEPYGRLFFWVSSRTRKGLRHLVDLEPQENGELAHCTCEAFFWRVSYPICAHIRACIHFVIDNDPRFSVQKPKPTGRRYRLDKSKTMSPEQAQRISWFSHGDKPYTQAQLSNA